MLLGYNRTLLPLASRLLEGKRQMRLSLPDIVVLVLYFVAMITVGVYVTKRASKSLDSYFLGVAGRSLMRLLLVILAGACSAAAAPTVEIKINQAGYLPGFPKIAVVMSDREAGDFTVRRKTDNSVVFAGKLSAPIKDQNSQDLVRTADFSKLEEPGVFYVDVPGVGTSWSFSIGTDVYRRAFYLSMRSYYGQRCGIAVDLGREFPQYKHAACHLFGAYHATSGKTGAAPSTKGWHDAGDYGRYIVNSGITTGQLLWAYELFASRVGKVKLNIPESANSIPDILDEIRWNLDWMFSMQDDDGGVWHKQTSEQFAGFVMPENDKLLSYVVGTGRAPFKSSCATADYAAVMAIAARVYKSHDAAYARRCLFAAEQAWKWLQRYPETMFRNSGGVVTGEYGDRDCTDERLWAAAELWRSTSEEPYERYFLTNFSAQLPMINAVGPPSWPRVAPLALWAYALDGGAKKEAARTIRDTSLRAANEIVERTNANPYRTSMTTRDFIWGSNGVAANYGVQLMIANLMNPDVRYVATATENLHYLLGRNTFSLSWVSQLGENPFRRPHHRPSQSDNNREPWPGLLSGGPNQFRQDPAMKKLAALPPAKMYLDDWESYATNENAINWNAPLVLLLAGLIPEE
jgi:endoglucanase